MLVSGYSLIMECYLFSFTDAEIRFESLSWSDTAFGYLKLVLIFRAIIDAMSL